MLLEETGQRRLPEGVCCDWTSWLWARSRMMRLSFLKAKSHGTWSNADALTLQVQGAVLPIYGVKSLSLSETSLGAVVHLGTTPVSNGSGQ